MQLQHDRMCLPAALPQAHMWMARALSFAARIGRASGPRCAATTCDARAARLYFAMLLLAAYLKSRTSPSLARAISLTRPAAPARAPPAPVPRNQRLRPAMRASGVA